MRQGRWGKVTKKKKKKKNSQRGSFSAPPGLFSNRSSSSKIILPPMEALQRAEKPWHVWRWRPRYPTFRLNGTESGGWWNTQKPFFAPRVAILMTTWCDFKRKWNVGSGVITSTVHISPCFLVCVLLIFFVALLRIRQVYQFSCCFVKFFVDHLAVDKMILKCLLQIQVAEFLPGMGSWEFFWWVSSNLIKFHVAKMKLTLGAELKIYRVWI